MIPAWGVRLDCGHEGAVPGEPRPGDWLSCWSIVPAGQPHCQTPRKIIEIWQIALFPVMRP